MNRRLQFINLFGVLALAVLCVFQWQRDRRLNLELTANEKTRQSQERQLAENTRIISGLTDDLARDERVGAVGCLLALDRVQRREQRVAVLLDLRPLVPVPRVLDRELVQRELLRHLVQLFVRRLEQGDPDEAVAAAHVLADVLLRDVGELAAILVGDAADQHGAHHSCGGIAPK